MKTIFGGLIATFVLLSATFGLAQQPQRTQTRFTAAQIELGRILFHDTRLSRNQTVACASCHKSERLFTDGLTVAKGINGRLGDKNTPTVLTAFYAPRQFWNGRTDGVFEQSIQPLVNQNEMGFNDVEDAMDVLRSKRGYRDLFKKVYGDPRINRERFAAAIGAYESTKMIWDSPMQQRIAGYQYALPDDQAERGYQIMLRSRCFECHSGPLFTDMVFHNTGVSALIREQDRGRIDILPQNQRQNTPEKLRAWKTPTLLGLKYTAPYTHAGSFPTLHSLITHYGTGGGNDRFRDPRIAAIRLNSQEIDDVVHFLETSTHSLKNNPRDSKPAMPR